MQGDGPQVLIWLIPAAALGLGVVLMWLGFKGRKLDDHPICRKCGQDLLGLPATLAQCPKCGLMLQPGDVLHGRRRKSIGVIACGAILAVPGLLALSGVTAAWALEVPIAQFKPVWVLARELEGDSRAAASAELTRRLSQQKLSRPKVQELVSRFLDDQADTSRIWRHEKGDFVELAYQRRMISEELWDRYVQQGVGTAVTPRPVISAGRRLPVDFLQHDLRMGSVRGAYSGGFAAPEGIHVTLFLFGRTGDDKPLVVGRTTLDFTMALQEQPQQTELEMPYIQVTSASSALGEKDEVELTLVVSLGRDPPLPVLESCSWRAPVKLVRRQEDSVKVRDDSQSIEAIYRALAVRSFEVDMPDWWRVVIDNESTARYEPPTSFEARLTVAMAGGQRLPWSCYTVWIDDGSKEHLVGTYIREGGYRLSMPFDLKEFDGIRTDQVDVILRPNLDAAENYTDVLEICGGEIVLKDVPVTYEQWYEPQRRKLAQAPPGAEEKSPQEDRS